MLSANRQQNPPMTLPIFYDGSYVRTTFLRDFPVGPLRPLASRSFPLPPESCVAFPITYPEENFLITGGRSNAPLPGARLGNENPLVERKPKPQRSLACFPAGGEPWRSERRERRSPLSILLRVYGFSAGGRIFSELTRTLNVSRSGCCLRLHTEPLREGTLALQIVPREDPLHLGARQLLYQTIWLRKQGDGWEVGLSALGQEDLLQAAFSAQTP